MTKHERIIELIRHRDIILATLDYILKGIQNETPAPDHLEVIIEYYEQQKLQTEKYFQTKRLDRLQQKLIKLITFPQGRGDLNFAAYVKEKTGHHIDIFASIRKRADTIIAQNQVKDGKDLHDVAIFFTTYGHHPEYQAKLNTLKTLVSDFGERTRKKTGS